MRALPFAWLAFAAVATATGTGSGEVTAPVARAVGSEVVVARVEGVPITFGELMFRYAQLPHDVRRGYESRPDGLRLFLADVIAKEEVLAAAVEAQVEADPLFARLMALKRAEVMLDLYARRTLLSAVDEDSLRARYDPGRFTVKPRMHLRYLLVTPTRDPVVFNGEGSDAQGELEARAKAERLRAEIAETGQFAVVARRSSEDASARNGGDLGWVEPESLVKEVAAAARTLAVGEVSRVIPSPLGFHVLQVIARRDGGTVPFEIVRELLLQEVAGERRTELEAKARADRVAIEKRRRVEAFPERLP